MTRADNPASSREGRRLSGSFPSVSPRFLVQRGPSRLSREPPDLSPAVLSKNWGWVLVVLTVALCGVLVDYLVQQCEGLVADLFLGTRIVVDEDPALNRILGQSRPLAKFEEKLTCLDEN
jgi:hypothetical protein